MDQDFSFTDLIEAFRGPEGSALAASAAIRLKELRDAVEGRLSAGVPPGDYDRYRQLSDALAAAARIVVLVDKSLAKDVRGGG